MADSYRLGTPARHHGKLHLMVNTRRALCGVENNADLKVLAWGEETADAWADDPRHHIHDRLCKNCLRLAANTKQGESSA